MTLGIDTLTFPQGYPKKNRTDKQTREWGNQPKESGQKRPESRNYNRKHEK